MTNTKWKRESEQLSIYYQTRLYVQEHQTENRSKGTYPTQKLKNTSFLYQYLLPQTAIDPDLLDHRSDPLKSQTHVRHSLREMKILSSTTENKKDASQSLQANQHLIGHFLSQLHQKVYALEAKMVRLRDHSLPLQKLPKSLRDQNYVP